MEKINISFVNRINILDYDPSNIQYDLHAVLLRQLYLTLFIYEDDGKIGNFAANGYSFTDNILSIQVKKNIYTTNNNIVTAKDFELSFKRLIVLSKNTHGDLNLFIDNNDKSDINDTWTNLWSEGNTLFIRLKENVALELFLPLLASNDFSVIPKSNIDWNDKGLKITTHGNTPGAYFYHSTSAENIIKLEKNVNSIIDTKLSPKHIFLHPHWGDKTYDKMKNNEIDLKPTIDPVRDHQSHELINKYDYSLKKTINIKECSFHFTSPNREKLSSEVKFKIGNVLRNALIENGKSLFGQFKPSIQFISPISEGALSIFQENILSSKWKETDGANFDPGFTVKILAYGIPDEDFKNIFGDLKWLKRIRHDPKVHKTNETETADVFFSASDSNFYESISFISYNLSFGRLTTSNISSKQWLQNYVTEKNKSKRLEMLQNLHFENLISGNVIPVGHSYYSILHRKNLNVPMYKEFAEMMFWKITEI